MAVTLLACGGRIVLDGSGTDKQPFDCKRLTQHGHHRGIYVKRNVTIASLNLTRAHVTCRNGFHFHPLTNETSIILRGIKFLRTPLKFTDCSHVEILNCIFRDTQKAAVTVQVQKSQKVNVTIRNSLFQSNSVCLNIQFEEVRSETDVVDVEFSLNIFKTNFLENGFNTSSTERGAVLFSNQTDFSRMIYLNVIVEHVMCVAGQGYFVMTDLPTAVSEEIYRNVSLERNHFYVARSLYYSRVKTASIAFFGLQCRNNSEVRCLTIQSLAKANETIDLRVHGSRFYDNSYNRTKRAAIFRVTGYGAQSAGMISIVNTSFVRNYRFSALSITSNLKIRLHSVTIKFSSLGLGITSHDKLSIKESNFSLDVNIDKCTFLNNRHDLFGLLNNTFNVGLGINNTLFEGKDVQKEDSGHSKFAIKFIIPPSDLKAVLTKVNIDIQNVSFVGRPASSFVLLAKGDKTVNIRGCKFRDGFSVESQEWIITTRSKILPGYVTGQGVFLFLFDSDKLVDKGCVKYGGLNIHPKWNYTNHVLFEDSIFENNHGREAGAIQIINGYVTFRRCTFKDNFAIRDTGHVYVGYGSAKVVFESSVFKRIRREAAYKGKQFTSGTFLHSESGGPIDIKNTSFETSFSQRLVSQPILRILSGGYFDMDINSTIQCATGSKLRFENYTHFHYDGGQGNTFCLVNTTTEIFSCRMCPPRMYSLQRGFSRGLSPVKTDFECLRCPFGAHCNGTHNIVAKPDFWGCKVTNSSNFSSLVFVPCPEEYCRRPTGTSQNNHYNSCYGNRSGILCGGCAPGFSETLLSTECRMSEECRWNYLPWILMALYTVGLTLYLLKKPPLVHFLKVQSFWFRNGHHQELNECSYHENGFLKITFYFYQVVKLLSTTSLENMMTKVPYIATVAAAFNFEVHIVDKGIGCPFVGLTAVTKEIFLSGLVFAAITHVFVIYCLHLVVSATLKKRKPLLAHYVAVALEITLLGYERLAETSLKLMRCVSIGSKWRLFFDGNIICWHWWQYGLLAFNVIFVVPFVGVLYWGSCRLYNKTISWKEFVCACIVPLPYLVYWLGKRLCTTQSENQGPRDTPSCEYTNPAPQPLSRSVSRSNRDECTDEISKILYGPFRAPSAHDQGTLYWESVLIGRRLVLLMFRAFIPNGMICFLCMSVACVLMVVHHLHKQPYRDRAADRMETLSLVALSCIAIINVTNSTLASSAVRPEGLNKSIMVVLQWIQVAILCIAPAVIALLIVFALFSQLFRFAIFLKQKICTRLRRQCCAAFMTHRRMSYRVAIVSKPRVKSLSGDHVTRNGY